MRTLRDIKEILDQLDQQTAGELESQDLEFKEWDSSSMRKAIRTVIDWAIFMANGGGGTVVFGVADKVRGHASAIVGGLRDQIRRASVSVMSNIAEGFGRGGNREFVQFFSIAKGSTTEVQSQLYVALDAGYRPQEQFEELYGLAHLTGKLAGGFIRYLNKSTEKGVKYA